MQDPSPQPRQSFPATRWSLIDRIRLESDDGAQSSLGELLTRYLPALRNYLMKRRRVAQEQAEDWVQGFIADRVLEKRLVEQADQSRGRFRSLLLTALDHYVVSQIRHDMRARRQGSHNVVSLDENAANDHASAGETVDVFDREWAQAVLAQTLESMKAECARRSMEDVWGLFDCRIAGPMLRGEQAPSYEQVINRFGFESPAKASNALVTAKRMFTRRLRQTVAGYVDRDEEIEREIADLQRALVAAATSR